MIMKTTQKYVRYNVYKKVSTTVCYANALYTFNANKIISALTYRV